MLKLKNIRKSFSKVKVLDGFDLHIKKGEILVLLGPSGGGKTTILNIVADLLKADGGLIEKNTSKVGYVFQEDRLLPWLSVRENVAIVNSDTKSVDAILEKLNLLEYSDSLPDDLSGGMKQRTAIARAYNYSSDLLLMDEPFKSLDYKLKSELIEDLLLKWKEDGNTYLIVTHDEAVAAKLATRILILSKSPIKIVKEIELNDKPYKRTNEELIRIEEMILGDENYEKNN